MASHALGAVQAAGSILKRVHIHRLSEISCCALTLEVQSQEQLQQLHKWEQGNTAMYSAEAVEARYKNRTNKEVHRELNMWWDSALAHFGSPEATVMCRDMYLKMYVLASSAVLERESEDLDEAELVRIIEEAWESESGGQGFLTRSRFYDSLFELVDMWTETTEAAEYVEFLRWLHEACFDKVHKRKWAKATSPVERMRRSSEHKQRRAAVTIQKSARGKQQKQKYYEQKEAATRLQAQARGEAARKNQQRSGKIWLPSGGARALNAQSELMDWGEREESKQRGNAEPMWRPSRGGRALNAQSELMDWGEREGTKRRGNAEPVWRPSGGGRALNAQSELMDWGEREGTKRRGNAEPVWRPSGGGRALNAQTGYMDLGDHDDAGGKRGQKAGPGWMPRLEGRALTMKRQALESQHEAMDWRDRERMDKSQENTDVRTSPRSPESGTNPRHVSGGRAPAGCRYTTFGLDLAVGGREKTLEDHSHSHLQAEQSNELDRRRRVRAPPSTPVGNGGGDGGDGALPAVVQMSNELDRRRRVRAPPSTPVGNGGGDGGDGALPAVVQMAKVPLRASELSSSVISNDNAWNVRARPSPRATIQTHGVGAGRLGGWIGLTAPLRVQADGSLASGGGMSPRQRSRQRLAEGAVLGGMMSPQRRLAGVSNGGRRSWRGGWLADELLPLPPLTHHRHDRWDSHTRTASCARHGAQTERRRATSPREWPSSSASTVILEPIITNYSGHACATASSGTACAAVVVVQAPVWPGF